MEQLNEEFDNSQQQNNNSGHGDQNNVSKDSGDGKSEAGASGDDHSKDKLTKMDIKNVVKAVKLVNEMKKRADGSRDNVGR